MENLLWRQQTEPEGDMDDDSSRVGHVHPPAPAPAPAPTAAAATQQTAKREHSDSVSHARPMVTARLELPTGFNAAEALKLKARVIEPDGKRLPARITMDSRQPAGRNCDVLRIVFQPQRTGLHQVVVSVDGVYALSSLNPLLMHTTKFHFCLSLSLSLSLSLQPGAPQVRCGRA